LGRLEFYLKPIAQIERKINGLKSYEMVPTPKSKAVELFAGKHMKSGVIK